MDKQLIDIAHEMWAAAQLVPGEGVEDGVDRIVDILARIDAERGKEAVATKLATDNPFSCFKVSLADSEKLAALPPGTQLFLSPTIPEGMALVKIEPTIGMSTAGANVLCHTKADVGTMAYLAYRAMIAAAQGERNA